MESGFLISYAAFILEVLLSLVTVGYLLFSSSQTRPLATILIILVSISGVVALVFPVAFIVNFPSTLSNVHPFNMALLIGSPLMPIVLFLWLHTLRGRLTHHSNGTR